MNPGRLVFPAIRWGDRRVDRVWREVRRDLDLGVGGFVVFGGSVSGMRELANRAFERENRPLLFAADLERGAGQQFAEATTLPPPAALAGIGDEVVIEAAKITAQEASSAGVGWVLGPVADLDVEALNPIVGTRSFGSDAAVVSRRVRAWVTAAQNEGVHACAKHFPGHGRTTSDSHSELPAVRWTRETLEADLAPFRAAVEAGVASVMMAHVAYSALDPSGTPASLSRRIVRLLRGELGFDGLIASDALIMAGVSGTGLSETEAAVEAVRAGCDVLLYPSSPADTIAALRTALESKRLAGRRVARSAERVEIAARTAELAMEDWVHVPSYARALELGAASVTTVRGSGPHPLPRQAFRLHVIDDDVAERPEAPAAPGASAPDRGGLGVALTDRGARLLQPWSLDPAIDLIVVFSDVRGWKRRAWLAPDKAREVNRLLEERPGATVVLFGHPRLADQFPAALNVLCAWCGDRLMQDAVAEHLIPGPTL